VTWRQAAVQFQAVEKSRKIIDAFGLLRDFQNES
jgi:hypothetical protein